MEHQEELFKKRRAVRLSGKELYTLANWLQANMVDLQKAETTRVMAAGKASVALGFEVRASSIEAAENMLGCTLTTPRRLRPMASKTVRAEIAALKLRIDYLEKQTLGKQGRADKAACELAAVAL